jgi:hypothetical protein
LAWQGQEKSKENEEKKRGLGGFFKISSKANDSQKDKSGDEQKPAEPLVFRKNTQAGVDDVILQALTTGKGKPEGVDDYYVEALTGDQSGARKYPALYTRADVDVCRSVSRGYPDRRGDTGWRATADYSAAADWRDGSNCRVIEARRGLSDQRQSRGRPQLSEFDQAASDQLFTCGTQARGRAVRSSGTHASCRRQERRGQAGEDDG